MTPKEISKLSGTVEIDEVYIGGRMKNKHKSVRAKYKEYTASHTYNKTGVMGFAERGKDLKAQVIDTTGTFKDMIRSNVELEAFIITDSLNAYTHLDKESARHEIINHIYNEYVRGNVHTNTIEGFFAYLKRSIFGIYHQVSPKHLQRYCDENGYRYNNRKMTDPQRFVATLNNIERRLDYKTLVGKK